jgi:uncharacterized repeat protein (TIGR03803 family)
MRSKVQCGSISQTTSIALASVVLLLAMTPRGQAQTYSVLYTFTGVSDGFSPRAGLIRDSAGNLYGTTESGGKTGGACGIGCGTVFMVDPAGNETVLHAFGGAPDGSTPTGGVVRDAEGNLYGTTAIGGSNGGGIVFRLDKNGKETVLHTLGGSGDGAIAYAGLFRDAAGNLYGTTAAGGSIGSGTIYKVDSKGNETVLYSFSGGVDGGLPYSTPMLDPSGNLYGVTFKPSVLFRLDKLNKETVLHAFTGGIGGEHPAYVRLVRDPDGNLYGTTDDGGIYRGVCRTWGGCGVVFTVDKNGQETVLYSFTGNADGSNPPAGLIRDAAGNLYGTTTGGGDLSCAQGQGKYGCGVVFKVDKYGQETVLYSFTGQADGAEPGDRLLLDGAGNLYGTTGVGGDLSCNPPYGCGVVFKLTP